MELKSVEKTRKLLTINKTIFDDFLVENNDLLRSLNRTTTGDKASPAEIVNSGKAMLDIVKDMLVYIEANFIVDGKVVFPKPWNPVNWSLYIRTGMFFREKMVEIVKAVGGK